MKKNVVFSIVLGVFDSAQLLEAAQKHALDDGGDDVDMVDDEGNVNIAVCLAELLDPGKLPGCSMHDTYCDVGE